MGNGNFWTPGNKNPKNFDSFGQPFGGFWGLIPGGSSISLEKLKLAQFMLLIKMI
jgi:hypothetical protein